MQSMYKYLSQNTFQFNDRSYGGYERDQSAVTSLLSMFYGTKQFTTPYMPIMVSSDHAGNVITTRYRQPSAAPILDAFHMFENQWFLDLTKKLGVELFAATIASFAVAPSVAIIDRAISCNASGRETMNVSLYRGTQMLLRSPVSFLRQPFFIIIWGVFFGTYATANCIETIGRHSKVPYEYPKFLLTSCLNVTLSVRKDAYYTIWFGKQNAIVKPLASGTLALFGVRDCMTMIASFIIPEKIYKQVSAITSLSLSASLYASQLIVPVATQIVSTPINLWAMHLYNVPRSNIGPRLIFIRKEYFKTLMARCGRIFPAFGVGGSINYYIRDSFGVALKKN